jgi:hypothetical protein
MAAESYSKLIEIWSRADDQLPELREAKAFSDQGKQR